MGTLIHVDLFTNRGFGKTDVTIINPCIRRLVTGSYNNNASAPVYPIAWEHLSMWICLQTEALGKQM